MVVHLTGRPCPHQHYTICMLHPTPVMRLPCRTTTMLSPLCTPFSPYASFNFLLAAPPLLLLARALQPAMGTDTGASTGALGTSPAPVMHSPGHPCPCVLHPQPAGAEQDPASSPASTSSECLQAGGGGCTADSSQTTPASCTLLLPAASSADQHGLALSPTPSVTRPGALLPAWAAAGAVPAGAQAPAGSPGHAPPGMGVGWAREVPGAVLLRPMGHPTLGQGLKRLDLNFSSGPGGCVLVPWISHAVGISSAEGFA